MLGPSRAPTHEPGFDLIWAYISLGELSQIDPYKINLVFDTWHILGRYLRWSNLFHVEHKVDFMVNFFAIFEALFCRQQQGANGGLESCFFHHLTGEGHACLLSKLDMAAG